MRPLVISYACEPDAGSEPGMGWAWVRHLSQIVDISVITRANNRGPIESWLRNHPGELGQVEWAFVDLPRPVLRLKSGAAGRRWYYALWQAEVLRRFRGSAFVRGHSVAHHVSYMSHATTCTPFLGLPSIVGPVGGLVRVPSGFERVAGMQGYEALRDLRIKFRRWGPLWRTYFNGVDLWVLANQSTRKHLPPKRHGHVANLQIGAEIPPYAFREAGPVPGSGTVTRVLWGGAHLKWKGLELCLRAVAQAKPRLTNPLTMTVTGDGPDRPRVERLAHALGLSNVVDFKGRVTRRDYFKLLAESDIFLFSSLHETTGLALIEAMALGRAIIVVAHGGPDEIAVPGTALRVIPGSPSQVVTDIADALSQLNNDPGLGANLGRSAQTRYYQQYSWPRVAQKMVRFYSEVSAD